jgi:electron transfer flavoprotein alpha subunit
VGEHSDFKEYHVESYVALLSKWVEAFKPDIFLAGATDFGRELFPRLAKRLKTGLSADCVALEADPEDGLLLQTTPAFGGALLAEVVTPQCRPQMATVHPGVFKELPHNVEAVGRIIYPEVKSLPVPRVELIGRRRQKKDHINLENASLVVVGGRGLMKKTHFDLLHELAALLDGEVGATRPVVRAGWADENRLLGQTGKNVKPKLLIAVGTSGALQFTTGIQGAETIIAINRDPLAPIFKMAELGLVGDAGTIIPALVELLRRRL